MLDDFVDESNDEEESFADLLESYDTGMSEDIQIGDKIRGEIISIGRENVFIDTGTKIDGVVDREELLDDNLELHYREGDILELYVVSYNGHEIRLSSVLSGVSGLSVIEDAFEKAVPVEGKVKGQCKGGFNVEIMERRAFCPISQIDLKFVENPDEYVGETYPFLIIQFEEDGRNIVISRRELLNREQESAKKKFYEQITVGTELDGKVTRLMPYGAFVEIFPGVEGMVHLSEISWSRVEKADKILNAGDSIKVKVIEIKQVDGHDRLKIALSIKQITGDPWESVEENFHNGDKVRGKVTRCKNFGAFVEITPGVEGLVHISEMSYTKRILKPEDVVKAGDNVSVVVKEIDAPKRKISLSLRDAEGDPWTGVQERYNEGQSIEGIVEKKEKFGYFVTIEPGITGLLPQSKIKSSLKPGFIEKLRQGDTIDVIIQKIDLDKRKITLAPGDSRDEENWRNFAKPSKKPIGSLGEKLQQALKSRKG